MAATRGEPERGLAAFGLSLLTDLAPPGAWEPQPLSEPTLRLQSATPQTIAETWSGFDAIGWQGTIDGAPFVVERGRAGDHRFVHGVHPDANGRGSVGANPAVDGEVDGVGTDALAIHHLSADGRMLRCAPRDRSEPSWWRLVLDSVLFTVALIRGYEALHAAAVATPDGDGVIAVTAAMGGGKSTLLSELLGRGLALIADDVLVLDAKNAVSPPLAHTAPPLMTLPTARLPALALPALARTDPWPGVDAALDPAGGSGRVPAAVRSDDAPARPPKPICTLEDECWIAVPKHPRPLPLRSLVVLDRRRGAQLSLTRIDDSLAPLMGALMHFPLTPQRERARFELASVLAATTGLWRLTADLQTPPEALADTLLAGVLDGEFRSAGGAAHVCAVASRCC